ncbi:MAG: hypothetical protein PHU23_09760 [Dehalococcoidales bacterium]|nr:hypothetical protein [Dehalococcoidales bacterium]
MQSAAAGISRLKDRQRRDKIDDIRSKGQRVDNELHDAGIELAGILLSDRFPDGTWRSAVNNASGIDLQGYIGDNLDVVCEVKTHNSLYGNRSAKIKEALRRLQSSGCKNRF